MVLSAYLLTFQTFSFTVPQQEEDLKQKLDLRRRQGLGTQHNIAAAREQMEQDVGAPSPFDAPLDASLQVNIADSITGKSIVNQVHAMCVNLLILLYFLQVWTQMLATESWLQRNRLH